MANAPTAVRSRAAECAIGEGFQRFGNLPPGTRETYHCLTPAGYFAPYAVRVFEVEGDPFDEAAKPSPIMVRVS